MKRFSILIVVFFWLANSSFGCSCITPSTFCESITDGNGNINPSTILRGKITESTTAGKEIEVTHVIFGENVEGKFILRHGFCTLYYNDLEDDAEYIFAVSKSNEQFYLLNCAISYLKVEKDIVMGKIAPGISKAKYSKLSTLDHCSDAFGKAFLKNILNIFPNPTADYIRISNTSSENALENIQVIIFDSRGREVARHINLEGLLPEENWIISIEDFLSGLYLVQISNQYQEVTCRVVKLTQ